MLSYQQIEQVLESFRRSIDPPERATSWQVHGLLSRIHADIFDPALNAGSLRRRCRFGDNNVSCRFKHEVGLSIREYIESFRLQAACTLLSKDSFRVSQVALSVGYQHLQTFHRAFLRKYNCTPGTYHRRTIGEPTITEEDQCVGGNASARNIAAYSPPLWPAYSHPTTGPEPKLRRESATLIS